jgi:ubiquinone/menaquinone biosynthesis C-methylase UbiE
MGYVLEHGAEFERLEAQSRQERYSPQEDFKNLKLKENAKILDAGSGSGIASRYLAEKFKHAAVVGVDVSSRRVDSARKAGNKFTNLTFETENLCSLSFKNDTFDFVFSRYVFEHIPPSEQGKALEELSRCMKPGAQIWLIDIDGLFYNLYPRTPLLKKVLDKMEEVNSVDLRMGRKLPCLLAKAGFESITFEAVAISITPNTLKNEIELLSQKFDAAHEYIESFLPSGSSLNTFKKEYFETLQAPGSTLFYNKFIAKGYKPYALKMVRNA